MAQGNNSFIVYTDIKEIIDDLDDAQVATLFRAMVNYHIDHKDPKLTGSLKYIFIPIRQQMDRDAEKWESTRAARAENGRKGGIASGKSRAKANEANASLASSNEANEANEAVNTTVTGTVNTNTTVTTTTTKGRGSGADDDKFNLFKLLGADGIDAIYDKYPETGGMLIQEVFEDVRSKKKAVKNPVAYVLGYAKKVGWDDSADNFVAPWEAM